MNTRTRTTITLLTGLVTGLALAPSALAVTGCTNSYLNGNYAMQFSGLSAPGVAAGIGGVAVPATLAASYLAAPMSGDGAVAPIAGNARLIFDGNGNVSGYSSENMAGQWTQGNVTGAYTVNTDCTFSVALTDAKGNTENFGGVLVAQSNSALVMQTDAGTGVTGALKSTRGLCQTSDLFGSYGLQYSGTSLAMSAPYSSVGLITFDGQGNVTTAETRYNAGTSSQVQSAGTITVNPDCSFTMALSTASPAGSMNFFGIAAADNKQLLIVQSDSATATTGSLTSQ